MGTFDPNLVGELCTCVICMLSSACMFYVVFISHTDKIKYEELTQVKYFSTMLIRVNKQLWYKYYDDMYTRRNIHPLGQILFIKSV